MGSAVGQNNHSPLPELELSNEDSVSVTLKTNEEKTLKTKKAQKFEPKLVSNPQNYMESFRQNIDTMMTAKDLTLKELSERADMPFETLKGFIYGDAKDCKLSTAVKLARTLGVSVSELVGCGTIDEDMLECMQIYRSLPENYKEMAKWHLKDLQFDVLKPNYKKSVRVMLPVCASNGNLKKTQDFFSLDVSNIGEELFHRVFMGIKIPCNHYLPLYMRDAILLIANDRTPLRGEKTVITVNGNLVITNRVIENGVVKHYGARDGIYRADENEQLEVLGYIAKVL